MPTALFLSLAGAALSATLCAPAAALEACPSEAFAEASAAQRDSLLGQPCGGEHLSWKLDTPRANPDDAGPSLVKARFGSVTTERFASMIGTFKFDWSGWRSETEGARTERATLTASGLLRVDNDWSAQLNFGRDLNGQAHTQTAVTGIWQPARSGMLFAEWAGSGGTRPEARAIGGRWWLTPGRLALDFNARRRPDGDGWADQRLGLTLQVRH